MERLDNMYKALGALQQMGIPVSQEQKDMLAKLEEEYLNEELLPSIKNAIEEQVKDCKIPLQLSLTYTKEDGVTLERTEKPSEEKKNAAEKASRSKTSIIRVTFPDGNVVCHRVVKDTLIEVIRYAGLERVYSLRYPTRGTFLLSKEQLTDERARYQVEIADGYFLITNSSSDAKLKQIEYISHQLNLNLRVEMVDIETGETIENVAEQPRQYGERVYDRSRFSFEGRAFKNKIGFVHDLVERVLTDHPSITYKELEQLLPARSASNKFIISEDEWYLLTADAKTRYKTLPSESFVAADGIRFFISNQWNITMFKNTLLPHISKMGYKWAQEEA